MNSLIRGLGILAVVIGNPCNIRADEQPEPGGTLIVLNKSDGTASLIARRTGQVFATIPTGEAPHEVAVSPDHKTAVVGNYGKNNPGHTLTVIDLATRKVTKTVDLKKYPVAVGQCLGPPVVSLARLGIERGDRLRRSTVGGNFHQPAVSCWCEHDGAVRGPCGTGQ